MLCASLRYQDVELLRRLEDLEAAAKKGSTVGVPLLYPWANRLERLGYTVAGQTVELARSSPNLHFDEHGQPMHGVPWAFLEWDVVEASHVALRSRLQWNRLDLLAIYPFPHQVEMRASILNDSLTIETSITSLGGPVPVSFGFHPYFGIPKLQRAEWRLQLPRMQRLSLTAKGIPDGGEEIFPAYDRELGESDFNDGFALLEKNPCFLLSGAGIGITVEFVEGYRFAQVFAPREKEFIAIEPMTAPTNALISGKGLSLIEPGGKFRAIFRVQVEAAS